MYRHHQRGRGTPSLESEELFGTQEDTEHSVFDFTFHTHRRLISVSDSDETQDPSKPTQVFGHSDFYNIIDSL